MYDELAKKIMTAILADVTNRRGWRQEWDAFDADIKEQIRQTWIEQVKKILDQSLSVPDEASSD